MVHSPYQVLEAGQLERPGKKIVVPRFSVESWAQHMADPK